MLSKKTWFQKILDPKMFWEHQTFGPKSIWMGMGVGLDGDGVDEGSVRMGVLLCFVVVWTSFHSWMTLTLH